MGIVKGFLDPRWSETELCCGLFKMTRSGNRFTVDMEDGNGSRHDPILVRNNTTGHQISTRQACGLFWAPNQGVGYKFNVDEMSICILVAKHGKTFKCGLDGTTLPVLCDGWTRDKALIVLLRFVRKSELVIQEEHLEECLGL